MTQFHLGFLFFILYIGWILYRWLIRKDLRQRKKEFYFYSFFSPVWLLIYYWFFFKEVNHFVGLG